MVTTFEPGQYVGRVTRWALVKAKNENKTPQFALTFVPLGRVNLQNPDGDLLPCPEAEREKGEGDSSSHASTFQIPACSHLIVLVGLVRMMSLFSSFPPCVFHPCGSRCAQHHPFS